MDVTGRLEGAGLLRKATQLEQYMFDTACRGKGALCQALAGGVAVEPLLMLGHDSAPLCYALTASGRVTVTGAGRDFEPVALATAAGRPHLLALRRPDAVYWGRVVQEAPAGRPPVRNSLALVLQPLPAGALPFTNVDDYIADLHRQELALRQLRQRLQR